jgi:hypothetical protein
MHGHQPPVGEHCALLLEVLGNRTRASSQDLGHGGLTSELGGLVKQPQRRQCGQVVEGGPARAQRTTGCTGVGRGGCRQPRPEGHQPAARLVRPRRDEVRWRERRCAALRQEARDGHLAGVRLTGRGNGPARQPNVHRHPSNDPGRLERDDRV